MIIWPKDQMLAITAGKTDPTGMNRKFEQNKGKPLAGKSTLNRLELTAADATAQSPYKKIVISPEAVENLFVDFFLETHRKAPARIILDVDAADAPLNGNQEGKFGYGYYKAYCYLPLYIFLAETISCVPGCDRRATMALPGRIYPGHNATRSDRNCSRSARKSR
jgi:hypothetical protein